MRLTLVRHAFAGHKRDWRGSDLERPLNERGHEQAAGLASVLAGHKVSRIVSSPALRCRQTMQPLAHLVEVEIETWAQLGSDGTSSDIIANCFANPAFDRAVLCTHGELMEPLLNLESIRAVTRRRHLSAGTLLTKGTAWRLHLDDAGEIIRLVHLTPPRPTTPVLA
jgi:phosphohistidine phosphatase SixA